MAAEGLKHVMALEICKEPWSPVTEFVLNREPTWSHLLSYHSDESLEGQCHVMISPQQWWTPGRPLWEGILKKRGRVHNFEGCMKAFCNYGNIQSGKVTAAQSLFLRTNWLVPRALESVCYGPNSLICAIKIRRFVNHISVQPYVFRAYCLLKERLLL